jgi:isoquinoline 1-oxidoreductase subunit beta
MYFIFESLIIFFGPGMKRSNKFTRREFIRRGAAVTGGLLISFHVPTSGISALSENRSTFPMNSLLKIGEDDSIHIILQKVEMGQGISTTLSMLIAEELDCDWRKIKVEPPPSGKKEDVAKGIFVLSTGGSDTTRPNLIIAEWLELPPVRC